MDCKRLDSQSVDKRNYVPCDQTFMLNGYYNVMDYPKKMGKIKVIIGKWVGFYFFKKGVFTPC